jgi:hypothetical protein
VRLSPLPELLWSVAVSRKIRTSDFFQAQSNRITTRKFGSIKMSQYFAVQNKNRLVRKYFGGLRRYDGEIRNAAKFPCGITAYSSVSGTMSDIVSEAMAEADTRHEFRIADRRSTN